MPTKEIRPEDITCIIDTREKTPLNLSPLKTINGTLPTGDYGVLGLESVIAVERKSLGDLLMCVGHERERFEREMHRLLAYPSRLLVIESTLGAIELGQYRSKIPPSAVIGSLLGWLAAGIPAVFCPTHSEAGPLVARFLFIAARRRWREAQAFCSTLKISRDEPIEST